MESQNDMFHDNNAFPSDVFQIMDHEGNLVNKEFAGEIDQKKLIEFYEWMIRIRVVDTKANNMQRTGKMGTYASVYGQEACQVGVGLAMEKTDWLIPTFRETGMMWAFGVPIDSIFLYWIGNEIGSCHPEGVNCLPISIPVGSHLPHATGIAWANKMQGKRDSVAFCSFSDGATSTCDFHAALNFAGVMKTPNVFFCQNNQYAISTSRGIQTASSTIAQKAFAYGAKAAYIDGNDVLAVYLTCKKAREIALKEQVPVLIEAVTYRLGNHTTSDNAKLYREDSEVEEHIPKEPVARLKKYLESSNLWDEAKENELKESAKKEADELEERVLAQPKLDPKKMFSMLYKEMTPILEEQKALFESFQS